MQRPRRHRVVLATALAAALAGAAPASAEDFKVTLMRSTFSDDASTGKPAHIWSIDDLRAAAPEIENYFRLVSNGHLVLDVTVADAPTLAARASYTSATDVLNAALDSAETAGYHDAIANTNAIYFVERGYGGGNCNAYYGRHPVTHHVTGLVGEMAIQEGCTDRVSPDPRPSPSAVNWSGWEQEIGHALQQRNGRFLGHPAGYGDSFNTMDSCYPCSESAWDLTGAPISGGNLAPFPGWLSPTKVTVLGATAGGTVTLSPVEADPATTSGQQGLKIPFGAVDVPVSETERWTGSRYYMVDLHRRIRAGGYGPSSNPRMADEGVEIHEVMENRDPAVRMVTPCSTQPADTRCAGLPGATHDASFCSGPGPYLGQCWPFLLWHPGDTLHGQSGVDIALGALGTGGVQPVIVTRNPTSGADPFIIPAHTPPMNTAETVDLWVDSECNGYEYHRVGHKFIRDNPSGLRFGRRTASTFLQRTVIANGDDLCGDHDNRIYARVHNAGDRTANGVSVHFSISRENTVDPARPIWTDAGTSPTLSIPPHSFRETYVTFAAPLPMYRTALDLRAQLDTGDAGRSTNTFAEEHINDVEDPVANALRDKLIRYAQLLYRLPKITPPGPGPGPDPPYFDLRGISEQKLTLDPVSFTGKTGGSTRVPLNFNVPDSSRAGSLFVMTLLTDQMHTEVNGDITPSWPATAIHTDPQTVASTALLVHRVRNSRLAMSYRSDGALGILIGLLQPRHRAPVLVELMRGDRVVFSRVVLSDRRGRIAVRAHRKDAGRLTPRLIFTGDRTSSHAIIGPDRNRGRPPLPPPLSKLTPPPAFPTQFTNTLAPATVTLTCSSPSTGKVAISGNLDPAQTTKLQVAYRSPAGDQVERLVATDATGAFADQLAVQTGGTWSVQARWNGDGRHLPTSSQPCSADVGAPLPDLVISKVENVPQTDIAFTVSNTGNADAGPFAVHVGQTNGNATTTVQFSGLAAGASANGSVGCKGGVVTVTADSAAQVTESREDNNEVMGQFGC